MTYQDILRRYGVEFKEYGQHAKTSQGWIQTNCPRCLGGSKGEGLGLGYNVRGGYLNCWRCGPMPLAATVLDLCHGDTTVLKLLEDLDRGYATDDPRPRQALKVPDGLGPLMGAHRRFLRKPSPQHTGYDPDELVRLWKIQGIGPSGSALRWRIFIPVFLNGTVVTYTTRSIAEGGVRYRTALRENEAVSIREVLYGEDYCRNACLVVEGPLDVWAVGPGAVATCGIGYSRAQVLRISRYPVRVVCYDNQPDGQARARKLVNELKAFPGDTWNVRLETGKDPSRADKAEVEELRRRFLT